MHGTNNNDARPQTPLGLAKRGFSGIIHHLAAEDAGSALSAIELESRAVALAQSTADAAEKRAAFLEKREPRFTNK